MCRSLQAAEAKSARLRGMSNRADIVAAHRELVEASNGVRHLLVIEHLTSEKVAAARSRLARAYERAIEVDDEILCV